MGTTLFNTPWSVCTVLVAGLAMQAIPMQATASGSAADDWRYTIGVGVAGGQSPFLPSGESSDAEAIPWFSIESTWLHIDPSGLAVGVLRQDHVKVDALLAPRWLDADPADNESNSDIDRETGIDAGIRVATSFDRYTGTLELKSDVSDTSNGAEATLDLSTGFALTGRAAVGIKAGATWRDGDSASYLYGVRADEARTDRNRYALDSTLTPFAGLVLTYQLSSRLSAMAATEVEWLPDDIVNSPIVAQDTAVSSVLSMIYGF